MLQTAAIFQSYMILQHGKDVPVWGTGTPGTTVEAQIQGQKARAEVAHDGTWKVMLPALTPSMGETLEITDGGF